MADLIIASKTKICDGELVHGCKKTISLFVRGKKGLCSSPEWLYSDS